MPRVEELKQRIRASLFSDAAHFVMGVFLVILWCFVRALLSSSGRKRYKVLGAYDGFIVLIKFDAVILRIGKFCHC